MILKLLAPSCFLLLVSCTSYSIKSDPKLVLPGEVLSSLPAPGFSINSKQELHSYCVKTWQRGNEKLKYMKLHQKNFNTAS